MRCARLRSIRLFVVSLAGASLIAAAGAQGVSRFDGLDADRSGELSRGEFSQLPGFAGSPELFVDLDTDHDRALSRAEWIAGSPDDRGIPLGFHAVARQGAAAGERAGSPPASTRHGPNVPPTPSGDHPRNEPPPPLENERLSRTAETKRGMTATAPRPPSNPIPPGARPRLAPRLLAPMFSRRS